MSGRPDLDPERVLENCDVRFTRRSGPGGQHRNKVETAAILTHRPTGLSAEASERRSQSGNRRVALWRLRMLIATQVRNHVGPACAASALWNARLRGTRIEVNPEHDDVPALLAEALDMLAATEWDPGAAAHRLGTTASQLIKLLTIDARALAELNARRLERGQGVLRPR